MELFPQLFERIVDCFVKLGAFLDAIHDRLNTLQILLLLEDDVFDLGYSRLILVVIVLEGIDDLSITEGDQTVLEHGEVKEFLLIKIFRPDFFRNGLHH